MRAKADKNRNRLSINPDDLPPAPQQRAEGERTEPKKATSTDAGAQGRAPAKTQTRGSGRKQSDILDALADPDIEQLSIPVDRNFSGGLLPDLVGDSLFGAFDEFAVLEPGAGTDEGDQVWGIHRAPA